tara:strand:- start:100 stop:264 length:165 start_codon:yes stop_codon:yes gene_type:complete
MSTPTITKVQKRASNLNQQYYLVTYSHGITTLLDKDGDIMTAWLAEGNTPQDAD